MVRGYSWEDLSAEVAEEFQGLSAPTPIEDLLFVPGAEASKIGAVRRAAGSCADCSREAASGRSRCIHCAGVHRARERYRALAKRRICKPVNARDRARAPTAGSPATPIKRGIRSSEIVNQLIVARASARGARKGKIVREHLPDERHGRTHHFEISYSVDSGENVLGIESLDGYVTVGTYDDGRVGEVFLRMGKCPPEVAALLDQWAISMSVALQHGAPLDALCRKHVGARFAPAGRTRNAKIPSCTSVLDYVCRWLLTEFPSREGE